MDTLRAMRYKTFTNTIRQLLRKGDFLGRLGGEEFVVALENTELPNAQALAERLRLAIANSQTPNDGGIPIAITASFGLALYSRGESVDAWLARADAAVPRQTIGAKPGGNSLALLGCCFAGCPADADHAHSAGNPRAYRIRRKSTCSHSLRLRFHTASVGCRRVRSVKADMTNT
jgi:hypothetical protein